MEQSHEQQRKILADRLHHFVGDLVHLGTVVGDVGCGGGGMSKEAMKSGEGASATVTIILPEPVHQDQHEFPLRGILASELKCWHRLTEEEADNLVAFVKRSAPQPAQQEPVAVTYKEVWDAMNALYAGDLKQIQIAIEMGGKKLYTSPPAQRTWVGLTDEEFQWIYDHGRTPAGMMELVEAKHKEKT